MAMENGLTVADAIALQRQNNNDGWFGGDGAMFLFFLLAWGGGFGGGWGGNGWGGNAMANYATQADIQRGFDTNAILGKLDGLSNGLCDGFYGQNTTMLNGFNAINQNINQARFDTQSCCCETNRNIDAVRAENYKNTCEITNAIHAEGEATRALINQNTMQELRDNLQSAQLQLANLSQERTIINAVRPFPQPAYITCSPYTSSNVGCGCGGCGAGCGSYVG